MPEDGRLIPRRLINPEREETPRSLLDLIEQGPFDLETAAWWMSHVTKGASWIVGSGPGGIGKSTTMRSFLSVVPGDRPFAIAMPGEIAALADQKRCTISLELSDHRPPGYLWDQDLRDFFDLSKARHQLVGNVHADTVEETREQVVGACNVYCYPRNSSIISTSSRSSGWRTTSVDTVSVSRIRRPGGS